MNLKKIFFLTIFQNFLTQNTLSTLKESLKGKIKRQVLNNTPRHSKTQLRI